MKRIAGAAAMALMIGAAAFAQPAAALEASRALASLPADSVTVTNYYKQNVYDPSDAKIGEIADVLVDKEGRVTALIVSVGGFLGAGEKDVAVPFSAVQSTQKAGDFATTRAVLMNNSASGLSVRFF